MRKILLGLMCVFQLIVGCVEASEKFGYVSYTTTNIGDDIQALAAIRLLPKGSIPIDREFVSEFHRKEEVHTLMNGWFMHTKDCCWWSNKKPPEKSWPPSEMIKPLLISMYMTPTFLNKTLTNEGIEYLQEHGPVGTRDYYTHDELQKRGVPSYFSGCLTLTLDNPHKTRDDVIYTVDVNPETVRYIRSKTKSKVVELSHGVPQHIQFRNAARLKYAESLLEKYRRAKCVITTRLHVAMPCLAFETPVLFFGNPSHSRFQGLADLTHHCSSKDLVNGLVDYDFNNPPENPKDYLPIREQLLQTVEDWVKERM